MIKPSKKNLQLSPSQVIKITNFRGRLPKRTIYVYLPPGYLEQVNQAYPVLYMHDGQNCFETYVEDSYVGSWRADQTADRLILAQAIQPCIIVGVSNGGEARMEEYLPPYVKNYALSTPDKKNKKPATILNGRADQTAAYYQADVAPYIQAHYRALKGREHTATCGSSLGGLFSAYIAWDRPGFARHHAIMSPSLWITKCPNPQTRTENPRYKTIDRFRTGSPPDVRIWLDSGTKSNGGTGDDGLSLTRKAKTALLANGFIEGENFRYYIDQGANHHETAWASRFDKVLRFLFPIKKHY